MKTNTKNRIKNDQIDQILRASSPPESPRPDLDSRIMAHLTIAQKKWVPPSPLWLLGIPSLALVFVIFITMFGTPPASNQPAPLQTLAISMVETSFDEKLKSFLPSSNLETLLAQGPLYNETQKMFSDARQAGKYALNNTPFASRLKDLFSSDKS
jgi:hypothetical protein